MKQYFSPRELADAIGVSESSLKRWVDDGMIDATRTAGGHRRIARQEAIRFLRQSRTDLARPDVLGFPEMASVDRAVGQDGQDALTEALLAGQKDQAFGLLIGSFLQGASLSELFDGPVRSALCTIGELWQHSDDGILIEHRATDICIQAVVRLRLALPPEDPHAPIAVGGAPTGDPYVLPSLMAAAVLHEAGLQAINLGPETPLDVLRIAAHMHEAELVWLSLSVEEVAGTIRQPLLALADAMHDEGRHLVVGGRVHDLAGPLRSPGVTAAGSMAELAAYAKGLLAAHHEQARQADVG
jgi:excisionase family DNA binding protein